MFVKSEIKPSFFLWKFVVSIAIFSQFLLLRPVMAAQIRPQVDWMTGDQFRKELERPIFASWSKEELRKIVIQSTRGRGVSVVIDRRLDPSSEFSLSLSDQTLAKALEGIAELIGGSQSIPDNFVYLGPKTAAKQLKTLIELRKSEMKSAIPEQRRKELLRRELILWSDLDSPLEILDRIADQYKLKILNSGIIPHDLWAEAILPDATLVEALSVILIQFDQTFRWVESGRAIEIVEIPRNVSIQRKFRTKQVRSENLEFVLKQFPDIEIEKSSSDVLIKGTFEELEAISLLLQGKMLRPSATVEQADLRNRLFTLNTKGPVPVIAVIKSLEASGTSSIHFHYNLEELNSAGIDLEQVIELDVMDLNVSEFFKALFDPIGVSFQLEGSRVQLKPKVAKKDLRK